VPDAIGPDALERRRGRVGERPAGSGLDATGCRDETDAAQGCGGAGFRDRASSDCRVRLRRIVGVGHSQGPGRDSNPAATCRGSPLGVVPAVGLDELILQPTDALVRVDCDIEAGVAVASGGLMRPIRHFGRIDQDAINHEVC